MTECVVPNPNVQGNEEPCHVYCLGQKTRTEDGGVVADWCDVCGRVQLFRLTRIYSVGHVYYIPLGQGTLVGTARQCTLCGSERACDPSAYVCAMPQQEAMGRSVEDVLRATNPALESRLAKHRDFQHEMSQRVNDAPSYDLGVAMPTGNTGSADQRMLAALQSLNGLDIRREDVANYLEQLRKWDYLATSEREVLLHEIEAFVKQDRETHAVINFLKTLPTPSPD